MKTQNMTRFNNYLIVLGICLIILYSLFFPALENPDEREHLFRVLYAKTLWGEVINNIGGMFFDISSLGFINDLVGNEIFSYVNNNYRYVNTTPPIEYYVLKLINSIIGLLFFFLVVKFFDGNKFVLLWPSVTYYMSNFTSESLAYGLLLGATTDSKIKIFLALCISIVLYLLDRSIIIFSMFLVLKLFIMIVSMNNLFLMKKYSIYLFIISLGIYFISIVDYTYLLWFIPQGSVSNVVEYSHNLHPSNFNQLVAFILSFLMLSGSMSFYPTILFYIYMLYLLFNVFRFVCNNKTNNIIMCHLCSLFVGLSTFLLVSSFVPQLSHFRYYLFLVPPIVIIFTCRYPIRYLFSLTLVGFTYNIFFLNFLYVFAIW